MITNKDVKTKLCEKLGIAEPTLYKLAKRTYPALYQVNVNEAIYVLALEKGINLKRHLGREMLERIGKLHREYGLSRDSATQSSVAPKVSTKKRSPSQSIIIKMPSDLTIDDPLLPESIKKEARDMAAIYPLFYYLENSIRSFVCAAMEKYHGKDWWNTQVKQNLRDKVEGHKDNENKNMWHQKRGDREVDYLDFSELKKTYSKIRSKLTRDKVFAKEDWLDHLIDEVYASRCVIAHMNPLDADSIQSVKVKVKQWNKLIKAKYKDFR